MKNLHYLHYNFSVIYLFRGANFAITNVTANIILCECPISRAKFESTYDPRTTYDSTRCACCTLQPSVWTDIPMVLQLSVLYHLSPCSTGNNNNNVFTIVINVQFLYSSNYAHGLFISLFHVNKIYMKNMQNKN